MVVRMGMASVGYQTSTKQSSDKVTYVTTQGEGYVYYPLSRWLVFISILYCSDRVAFGRKSCCIHPQATKKDPPTLKFDVQNLPIASRVSYQHK